MNKTFGSFAKKAKLYARYRPTYSLDYKKYLIDTVKIAQNSSIADVGAGTGIHTKTLVDISERIYCVEPDLPMLQICEEVFKNQNNVSFLLASAEHTSLPDKSVDYITVAQAFHLFDTTKSLIEFRRILKKNGKLLLVWNSKEQDNKLFFDTEKLIKKFCPTYQRRIHARTFFRDTYDFCFEQDTFIFTCLSHDSTENLTKNIFVNRTLSASYALTRNNSNYRVFVEELKKIFDEHAVNGVVKVPQSTMIYHGEMREI